MATNNKKSTKATERAPITIPAGALKTLRQRNDEILKIQREFELQFRQRTQPIMDGITDLQNAICEMNSLPDIPHKFDLENGIITFDVEDDQSSAK